MIEIITPERYERRRAALQEMFAQRHRVFVERMGWQVESVDGLERDDFDALQPTYLLAWSDLGQLVGSWRLLPTTGRYMLRDVFGDVLAGRTPPCDSAIWETSRFAVETKLSGTAASKIVSRITVEMFCGLIEHSIASGIERILTVYDRRIARILSLMRCQPEWATPEGQIDGKPAIAGLFRADRDMLLRIRSAAAAERPATPVAAETETRLLPAT